MTDNDLLGLLISGYSRQYGIYLSLFDNLKAGLASIAGLDGNGVISLLEARNRDFDRIKEIDTEMAPAKAEWEERGGDIHSMDSETLRTILSNIRSILSKVIDTNRQLEEALSDMVKKR